jgi:predicted small lipoprotein YifL
MVDPRVAAAILAALIGLAACGQRGPLVLPKPPDAPASGSGTAPKDGVPR